MAPGALVDTADGPWVRRTTCGASPPGPKQGSATGQILGPFFTSHILLLSRTPQRPPPLPSGCARPDPGALPSLRGRSLTSGLAPAPVRVVDPSPTVLAVHGGVVSSLHLRPRRHVLRLGRITPCVGLSTPWTTERQSIDQGVCSSLHCCHRDLPTAWIPLCIALQPTEPPSVSPVSHHHGECDTDPPAGPRRCCSRSGPPPTAHHCSYASCLR